MNRRFLISSLAVLPLVGSARAAMPWTAQFLAGNFDGKSYSAGLYVKLEKNWKTYWRNPGDGGVPPSITAEPNSNLAGMMVEFPLPLRIVDESGTAFGYHDEVLFPIVITPKDISQPLNVNFSSFFGVCEKVCTPAKFEGMLDFSPKSAPTAEAEMITKWRGRIPQTGSILKTASVRDKYLRLELKNQVSDIFVEGPDNFYFGQPEFDLGGENAHLKIAGLKNDNELKGVELRLTANINGQGVEQRVVVA
jgi:DsbC/DsbD-like thiol-disulfide interchange protein